jgi:SIR2-like domain
LVLRFLPEGPSIPDELLVARDEGRVVFFCGAGVSRARAGLSDFLGLTKAVAEKLAISAESPTRRLIDAIEKFPTITGVGSLVSADRVFGLMEREFLSRDIYAAIASSLKPVASPDLSAHRTLLDLAKSPDGKTKLVTTNFDLLFEACDLTLDVSRPPRLPDPLRDDEFFGVVHLHGHVTDDYTSAAGDGLVISSAEFGRAYLSERWATNFIRTVLERYIVVFVGYAADDPPMQYLLEALNRTTGSLSGVYAFQSGSKRDAEARWAQKGVCPIDYDAKSNHDALWNTLEAWAVRARNPSEWYDRLIITAKDGPEGLQPYQRGQVAHVVSTLEGARTLSRASNPPPASWLCSFDPYVRFATPSRRDTMLEYGPYFDPFDAYGLDTDPVPKQLDPNDAYGQREVPPGAWDCFALTRQDRQNIRDDQFAAFRGHYSRTVPGLPARLGLIANWVVKIAKQPAAVWWAARQIGLHPDVQQQIKYEIQRSSAEFPPIVRKAWRYIFEAWSTPRKDFYSDWFELAAIIKSDGWSPSTVRQAAKIKSPYLSVESPFGAARPPEVSEELPLRGLVGVDVKYPDISEDIGVPNEHLPLLLKELRKNLELAVVLENEAGGYGLDILNPIETDEPDAHPYGINRPVTEFVKLFRRLTVENVHAAKAEASTWRENEDQVFTRLVVWACGDERITTSADAARVFSNLDSGVFWEARSQRDLLIAISKRWPHFSASARRRLERKLLKGRSRWKGEKIVEFKERRALATLSRIHWLAAQGCKFNFNLKRAATKLKAEAPQWQESFASSAADSMASRAGWVRTDTESEALLQVPLSEVLPTAQALSGHRRGFFVEYDPYAGLAAKRPVRALAALGAVADGYDATWAWETFLSAQARKDDKCRFVLVIAAKLLRLVGADFERLVRPISDWLLRVSKDLLVNGRDKFQRLWERLIATLDGHINQSSIMAQGKRHDWATEALNRPAGYLAQALFNDLDFNLRPASRLPEEWRRRADQLLSLSGDHRRHALAIFCYHLRRLFQIDPEWTERALVSAIGSNDDDDIAAFWAGFFWAAHPPQVPLYFKMKGALLALAHKASFARKQHSEILAGILLAGWGSRIAATDERVITNEEMRVVLIEADDDFRSRVIWHLEHWSKDEFWSKEALVFLKEVWPKQTAAKTPGVSARLAELAFSHKEDFPDYVDAVLPLVIPINRDHMRFPEHRVIEKFPDKTLQLMTAIVPDDARKWPYGVDDVLRRIGLAGQSLLSDERLVNLNRIWNAR